ncbi:hypothetical protein H0X32_03945 [Patescibacteria group bacterium]|nr:hypothetical protein [Patescibacteria group bacterium]
MANNVEFNDPSYARPLARQNKGSFLSKMVISMGLAKDEASAQKALIGVLVVVLVLTAAVWWLTLR